MVSVASLCCQNPYPIIPVFAFLNPNYFFTLFGTPPIFDATQPQLVTQGLGWNRKFLTKTISVTGLFRTKGFTGPPWFEPPGFGDFGNIYPNFIYLPPGTFDDQPVSGYVSFSFEGGDSQGGYAGPLDPDQFESGNYNATLTIDRITGIVSVTESYDARGQDARASFIQHAQVINMGENDTGDGLLNEIQITPLQVSGTVTTYVGPSPPGDVTYTYVSNLGSGQPVQFATASKSNITGQISGTITLSNEYLPGSDPSPANPALPSAAFGTIQGDLDDLVNLLPLTTAKLVANDIIAAYNKTQNFTGPIDPATGLPRTAAPIPYLSVGRRPAQVNPAFSFGDSEFGAFLLNQYFFEQLFPGFNYDTNNNPVLPFLNAFDDGIDPATVFVTSFYFGLNRPFFSALFSNRTGKLIPFNDTIAPPAFGATTGVTNTGFGLFNGPLSFNSFTELELFYNSPVLIGASKTWVVNPGSWLLLHVTFDEFGNVLSEPQQQVQFTGAFTLVNPARLQFLGETRWLQIEKAYEKI